jgi:hypothetical protein
LDDRAFGEQRAHRGGERIRVLGEMDLAVTDVLDARCAAPRPAMRPGSSSISDQLEFVDAAGIRLLLDLKARSDGNGGRLDDPGLVTACPGARRDRRRRGPSVRRLTDG